MPDKLYHECCELIAQSRETLNDLTGWGFETVTSSAPQDLPVCSLRSEKSTDVADVCRPATLAELEASLAECILCPLCESRQQVVFGVGNPQADLVLIGEAPGQEEDDSGSPFAGEAGELLDRILFAMKLTRQDVYLCYLLKCRPSHDRDPQASEIAGCEQFLRQQLAAIRPRMLIALGPFVAHALLQTEEPISQLRGHWGEYAGIPLLPTYHPDFLLSNPAGKRDVWQDMKQVMHRLQG